jgi:MFS family permease
MLTSYGCGAVVASLLGGWLTARLGAIRVQILSFAFVIPGFLALGQVGSFPAAIVALLYLSFTLESMRPAANTATIDFCTDESQHTRALAVTRLAVNLGMSIGPVIGGYLAAVDYGLIFVGNAAGAAAACLLMLVLFGWNARRPEHVHPVETLTAGSPSVALRNGRNSGSPFRDRRYVAFCLLTALGHLVLFQFLGTYPLYLTTYYAMTEVQYGWLCAVNTIGIVMFELVLVHEVRRFPMLRVYAWGQFLTCMGFGLLPFGVGASFGVGYAYCVATMLVLTLGEMLSMPLGAAYAARRSTPANRGKYMGLYAGSFSLALLLAPLAGMTLYEINPHLVWYAGLITASLVFLGLLMIADREQADSSAAPVPDEVAELSATELTAGAELPAGPIRHGFVAEDALAVVHQDH